MNFKPSHPDELELHHALRDELNRTLTSPNFMVLIDVRPSGEQTEFADLAKIGRKTEAWLRSLDPDEERDEPPTLRLSDPAAEVTIRAAVKKESVRAYKTEPIVGNPEPPLGGWV